MTHPGAEALRIWKERLGFLLREEAVASGAGQKFTLKMEIEEARARIRELQAEVDRPRGQSPARSS